LQEDKEPLFDSVDTLSLALRVNTEMIAALRANKERCLAAASDPMLLATDLADHLVLRGVPFRHAHELVGKAVARSIESGVPLDQLDFAALSPEYGSDAGAVFSLGRALAARTNPGAPSPAGVARELAKWEKSLMA
jgi:argininosuccinate lyase